MRTSIALIISLILVPAAATALVPGEHRLAWYNGDLDSAVAALGTGFGRPNARIADLEGDGDNEMVIEGHAFGGIRFTKNHFPLSTSNPALVATRTLVPASTALEFDVEGASACSVYHDIRVILLGTFDPLPGLDSLYDLSPVAPIDYFNDEVLVWNAAWNGGMLQSGQHYVLDPMQATLLGGGFGLNHPFNTMTETEKRVFLQQHYYEVWVFYGAAYQGGQSNPGTSCAFDNFAYLL